MIIIKMESIIINQPQMTQKSKLSISIHQLQFSKDFQYMISIQFQTQKKQTDISALVRNPIFLNNTVMFDLPSNHTLQGVVVFIAHIVMEEHQHGYSNNGNDKPSMKVLGECALDISPYALQPSEMYNLPIRQQMKFTRSKDGKESSVGRFIASFKIVREEGVPAYMEELEHKKMEMNQYYSQLPDFDQTMSFNWRIRIQIRQCLNIPSTSTLPPQVLVELGWTQYLNTLPQQTRIYSTTTLSSNHPQWNQTFIINNPEHVGEPKGFVMICLKDHHHLEDVFRIYVPVGSMGVFVPYNIKTVKEKDQSTANTEFYFSMVLECPYNKKDRLYDIIVSDITFQPLAAPFKSMTLVTVINSQNQPKIKFFTFDAKHDTIQRVLQFDQAQQFTYIMSQTMRIPPMKSSKRYRAATVVTISQSMLKKKISFYVAGKVERGVYKVVGLAEAVQKDLANLLIQKSKKKLFLPVRTSPGIKMGNCQIQIGQLPENMQLSASNVSRRGEQTISQKLMKQLNFTNNDSMLKHITQNNEIIARILKQLDDKSESLRQAASQISNLRGRVKLLQNQNGILRRNAMKEEDQLVNLVQREVENMSVSDLKDKIVKISQLYKSQKIKSRELQKTVKVMQPQISNSMQLNSVIASQKNQIQTIIDRMQKMAKDTERINIYKDTIRNQEKVIGKLQKVMKEGMEEVRNARKVKLEFEELKKRTENNQNNNGNNYRGSTTNQRDQIQRLQAIIAQQQTSNKPISGSNYKSPPNQNSSNYQLQFKLHQAETRIYSLQQQLQQKSKAYARQLAVMRMKMAEKEAVMNGYMI